MSFKVGDKVSREGHDVFFGVGTVVGYDSEYVEVVFPENNSDFFGKDHTWLCLPKELTLVQEPKVMGKTLKELNVKPGDVVRWVNGGDAHLLYIVKSAEVILGGIYAGEVEAVLSGHGPGIFGDHEKFEVVSRATTEDPKTWKDMTPEEKGALLLAHQEGKTIQAKSAPLANWYDTCRGPIWADYQAYRIKPEPKVEEVTMANWEEFGRIILERFCEGESTLEMMDIQDWAEKTGCLIAIPGGFDPEKHIDVTCASKAGDPFYYVAPEETES